MLPTHRLAKMARLKSLRFSLIVVLTVTISLRLGHFAAENFSAQSKTRRILTSPTIRALPTSTHVTSPESGEHRDWTSGKTGINQSPVLERPTLLRYESHRPLTTVMATPQIAQPPTTRNADRQFMTADDSSVAINRSKINFQKKSQQYTTNGDFVLQIAAPLLAPQTEGISAAFIGRTSTTTLKTRGHSTIASFGITSKSASSAVDEDCQQQELYVSFCPALLDPRRLGNRLFNVALLLDVAWSTGRRAVVPPQIVLSNGTNTRKTYYWQIDRIFNQLANRSVVQRTGYDVFCRGVADVEYVASADEWNETRTNAEGDGKRGCVGLTEPSSMVYNTEWQSLLEHRRVKCSNLLICGYFQSWKYFRGVEDRLRRVLTFDDTFAAAADLYMTSSKPPDWQAGSYARVGIHVRRGDFLLPEKRQYGYQPPPVSFYQRAVRYFLHRHRRVQFIVSSDDPAGARSALGGLLTESDRRHGRASVSFTSGSSAELDFAILSRCRDGTVVSAGTFGWWVAWLANASTVLYYAGMPRRGSRLEASFNRDDYVLPHWIPY